MSTQSDIQAAVIPSQKITYLDHIKVLLTVLVILHHTFITYGAPGGWYYKQPTTNELALIPMTLFVATNQAFFMGLFFMLSAYFIEPSYTRKGTPVFIADRLKRLGIPLLFYSFLLSPCMNFLVYRFGLHKQATFLQYLGGYDDWIDFGVLWFVAALLVFTLLYVALKQIMTLHFTVSLPGPAGILLFAAGLGLVSFVVRLVFPIGWILHPVGFQLGHFPQYITFFILGILARQNQWLQQLTYQNGRRFSWIAALMVLIVFPLMLMVKTRLNAPVENFSGGWHWESFVYSFWEQITGLSIIVALVSVGQERWNTAQPLLEKGSRYAFGVYIFHPLVIISLSLLLSDATFSSIIKLAIVAPLAVLGSFVLAGGLLKIPGVSKII